MSDYQRIKIAEIVYSLSVPEAGDHPTLHWMLRPYTTDEPPSIELQVHYGRSVDLKQATQVFDSGHQWEVYRLEDQWIIRAQTVIQRSEYVGVFSQNFDRGDIYIHSDRILENPLLSVMHPPIGRFLAANKLALEQGILLHASAIRIGDRGYLFSGTDGAGKTTTARLWAQYAGGIIMGDDQIAVRKQDNQFWLYSTPWQGCEYVADAVPLEQVFVIQHGAQNQLAKLSPAAAVAQLVKRSFAPLWSSEGIGSALNLLTELGSAVPVYDLAFLPDRSAVEFVRCLSST